MAVGEVETEAVGPLYFHERRDVENLPDLKPFISEDRPAIVVKAEIAMALAKGVADVGEHGPQRTLLVETEPETDGIERETQKSWQCQNNDFAIGLRQSMRVEDGTYPGVRRAPVPSP